MTNRFRMNSASSRRFNLFRTIFAIWGLENGVNSHQPTDPSVVFARGYGDCKDKALLFCTILRFFHIRATPVLVSTGFRQAIKGFIPTPLPFDHVIVQVIIAGKTNYVDATRPLQRGLLDRRFVDLFGEGLPLDKNATGLIPISATTAGLPSTIEDEHFDVSTNGGTELTVTHTFEGRDADFTRQQVAAVSRDFLENDLLAYRKNYYPDLVATKPPKSRTTKGLIKSGSPATILFRTSGNRPRRPTMSPANLIYRHHQPPGCSVKKGSPVAPGGFVSAEFHPPYPD